MSTFEEILSMPSHEVKRPPPMPPGVYLCSVQSSREGESTNKKTPYIEYTLKPLQPYKDVDEDELEQSGGLENRTLRATFYVNEGEQPWRLRKFLDDCGLEGGGKKSPIPMFERARSAVGCQVLAYVHHEPSRTPGSTDVFATVTGTAPVEE